MRGRVLEQHIKLILIYLLSMCSGIGSERCGEGAGTAYKTDINIFTVQRIQVSAVNDAGEGAGTAYKTDINIFTVNVFRYRQ